MKNVLLTLALVALFAAPAMAANGNLSNDMLSKMGLSGMQTMSDAQGTAVRGMGWVYASLEVHIQSGLNTYDLVLKTGDCGEHAAVASRDSVLTSHALAYIPSPSCLHYLAAIITIRAKHLNA